MPYANRNPSESLLRTGEAATYGQRPIHREDPPPPRRMQLKAWRPLVKNTLRGFAIVELPNGLTIKDVSVHQKDNKRWAGLPAKPVIGQDGTVVQKDGKAQYASIMEWNSRDLSDRFSAAVVELVLASHPDAFGQG